MDKIKRFIACAVPTEACNLRCSYCYLTCKDNAYNGKISKFIYPVEKMIQALSVERLGGICYFNMCAAGETTLQKDLFPLIKGLINNGHYCDIITNGTIAQKIDELILMLSDNEKSHLFLKFSFHYLQLLERNLLNIFVENVQKVKKAGISFTIEITPHDELIPYIDEIKNFSLENFGALPHISVARNEATEDIELLTKLSREDYKKTWSVFDSSFFNFKFSIFNRKIEEFCYAGQNSLYLDLRTGEYKSCYCGDILGNLFENFSKPIKFCPIGKCNLAHCFNGHAFIAWAGNVPDLNLPIPTYAEERNRVCNDGTEWLTVSCKEFFSSRADEQNLILNENEKKKVIKKNKRLHIIRGLASKMRGLKRRLKNKG